MSKSKKKISSDFSVESRAAHDLWLNFGIMLRLGKCLSACGIDGLFASFGIYLNNVKVLLPACSMLLFELKI